MPRLQRALAALSLVLSLVVWGAPLLTPATASAASSTTHNGRLGGTEASFTSRFGQGSGSASEGVTYHASGFESIVVTFDKDRASAVTATAAPGSSWATDMAMAAALELLPKDVKLDSVQHDTGDGRFELACTSKDLGKQFNAADYKRLNHKGVAGECYALESPDSPSTIHAMELSIGRAGSLDRPIPTPTPIPTPLPTQTPQPTAVPQAPAQDTGSTGSTTTNSGGGDSAGGSTTSDSGGGDTGTYVGSDGCTYTNVSGNQVSCPVFAPSAPAGATAQCNDGSYSFSQHARGTCSSHGGVAVWINYPGG